MHNFLFQHTSKISLNDILEAQKKKEEEEKEKKIKSPYTKEYKKKLNLWPLVYVLVAILVISVIIYIVISSINKKPERTDELKSKGVNIVYEYTY